MSLPKYFVDIKIWDSVTPEFVHLKNNKTDKLICHNLFTSDTPSILHQNIAMHS